MDPAERERVRDDLKGVFKGELLFDDLSRSLYATDASIFEVLPVGVAAPRDEEDVVALVRYAAENQLALIPRGAGTGLAGEALGAGLVVDLSRHFRAIAAATDDSVTVQPGVVFRDLAAHLARQGRRFAAAPDFGECTVGGMVATDASGSRAVRGGYTRDHVRSLRVVLDSAEVVEAGTRPRWPAADAPHGRLEDIVASVVTLLEQNASLLRTARPQTRFDRLGYRLHDVLDEEHLALGRLLVGSEGTLGLFTEVTLKTEALPGGRCVALLGYADLEAALRSAREIAACGPTACELIDRRLLRLAQGEKREAADLVAIEAEAVLLVEFEGDDAETARRAARDAVERGRPALFAEISEDEAAAVRLWGVREAAVASLYGLRGGAEPLAFVEDVAVPPDSLGLYLHAVQEILQRHETTASYLVHAAAGQVHLRPFLDLNRPQEAARLRPLAEDVHALAIELGGTVSSQHGTGLARTPWVARQYGALAAVFRDLKMIFDPRRLFNPGKIVADGLSPWPLRRRDFRALEPTELIWAPGAAVAEALACNGCGQCRTAAATERMCPIFRAGGGEEATPRAKANLLRHLWLSDADPKQFSSDDVRAVADLCVNCKMCASECPAHVDVPKLMLEVKAANTARHGLGSDWVLARTESFARLGSAFAPLANALLGSRAGRWVLEKAFGISRRRKLPPFAGRHFLRQAERRGWTRRPRSAKPRVAYFVDVFATYNDPTVAEAVVAVLQYNGVEVYVPPGQLGCGMAPLAYGDLEAARETVQHNLRIFADLAREGWPILCSEPTAALMLRHDALDLLDDSDARLVAGQTVEFTAFLGDLRREGRLRTDFRRIEAKVDHHVPCHLKALGRTPDGPDLLRLIPGLSVHTLDVSCSGMAGTFGLKAGNYATSLEAGRPMLSELAGPRAQYGSTECSTCRMQMEDGAGKRTLHPAQYLAMAYGYLPEVQARLRRPLRGLVLR